MKTFKMHCLLLNFFVLICVFLTVIANDSLKNNNETRSVKKDLKSVVTAETGPPLYAKNQTQTTHLNSDVKLQEENLFKEVKTRVYQKSIDTEIPESFKMGFYFFIGLSMTAIIFILIKIYRMRLSRAERKYGVYSDRSTQELTPLPMAIEDDSDNEDHTLFDINRQVRVS